MKYKTFNYYCGDFPVSVGDKYILVCRSTESGRFWFTLYFDNGGVPGNLNSSIKRYHGWRGCSYGVSTYAYGLRRIIRASPVEMDENGCWFQHITVGKDLHHDWK